MKKKVFVSGCFDLFHSGHAEFLKKASSFGDLYVAIGSDSTILNLKNIETTLDENQRLFIVSMIKCVKKAFISSGSGNLDFIKELKEIKPDIFIVNNDGDIKEKRKLCKSLGIEYKVLKRISPKNIKHISSQEIRSKKSKIPYRIDIAGGWLDQPYVSKYYHGGVITISIEANNFFDFRSGFATSTRNNAIKLWGNILPNKNSIDMAKILFSFDNPPDTKEKNISGSQDSIGITIPGLVYSYFNNKYWPDNIKIINDEEIISWLENKIYLVKLYPRKSKYNVFKNQKINKENVKKLSIASRKCYSAIINKDLKSFARYFTESFNAQISLFPTSLPINIIPIINKYKKLGALGWKLSGAGGGGYLILVSDKKINGTIPIKIRRQ